MSAVASSWNIDVNFDADAETGVSVAPTAERPDLNVAASPIVATSAVTVSLPMPGTAAMALQAASCFCQAAIRCSSWSISACSPSMCLS